MATTIKLKNGSGAPLAGDLVQGEPALDLTNKRLYTENASGTVIEVGTNPTSLTTGTFTSTGIDDNATSTAITIDASQNVTVGGNFSATKLTALNGTLELDDNGTHNGIINVPASLFINIDSDNTSTGEDFVIAKDRTSTSGGTELFRVQEDGKVGIGTASPSSTAGWGTLLEVSGTTNAGIKLTETDTANGDYSIGVTAGALRVWDETTSSWRMTIDGSGNVGIGTTNPSSLLSLEGSNAEMSFTDTARVSKIFTQNGGRDLQIQANQDLIINASGGTNVGIGTSSPGAPLHVSGTNTVIRITDTASTADYSFQATANDIRLYDNTASQERMRIDSSGNLLVGKTSASTSTVGGEINSDGTLVGVRASGNPLLLNRTTTDGAIATFRKDNVTVGSIGSTGGAVSHIILDPRSGAKGAGLLGSSVDANTGILQPTDFSGAVADGAIQLGTSSNRFKDLYLSGGAYLGGTGAANYLDDYEEGTWTPSNSGNITINTINNATYVKVGASVTINAWINVNITSSSFIIGGLPYSISGRTSAVVTNIDSSETIINQALGTTIYGYGASTAGTNDGVFISLTYRIA